MYIFVLFSWSENALNSQYSAQIVNRTKISDMKP